MNIFDFRQKLIDDYSSYISSFINIRDERIQNTVGTAMRAGALWPDSLIQLNPLFEAGDTLEGLIAEKVLHPECRNTFRVVNKDGAKGGPLSFYRHQTEAIRTAEKGENYILTTGTGSGKSLSYIVPIVNHVLKSGSGKGLKAIIVYPMNALANSQRGELEKFLGKDNPLVTFGRYTGQEDDEEREKLCQRPPDILLTNYVMLELILTRKDEIRLVNAAKGLRFLVLDELHTYRGRQGADVAMLVRRVRNRFAADKLQCVGTSATISSGGSLIDQKKEVARVATLLFGSTVKPENIIGETLRRATREPEADEAKFAAQVRYPGSCAPNLRCTGAKRTSAHRSLSGIATEGRPRDR